VNDGATTIIGGILQTQENNSKDSTPGLSKVPLLGLFFKRDSTTTTDQELTIFITPRIIRG
jgi:type IV pilus assembly protein PilQ